MLCSMNQSQIDLIEDPPPKNPYFTLPDPKFFLTPEDIAKIEKVRPTFTSLVQLFGTFDKMTDDQQTKFLLTVLKYSSFKPDFEAMANDMNLSSAYAARRRFVAIVEKQGFEVDGGNIKPVDETSATPTKTKTVPKKTSTPHGKAGAAANISTKQHKAAELTTNNVFEQANRQYEHTDPTAATVTTNITNGNVGTNDAN